MYPENYAIRIFTEYLKNKRSKNILCRSCKSPRLTQLPNNQYRCKDCKDIFIPAAFTCDKCKSSSLWQLKDGRFRCKKCTYTFNWSKDLNLSRFKIKAQVWLVIIEEFSKGSTVLDTSKKIPLSYKTILKAFNFIRYLILLNNLPPKHLWRANKYPKFLWSFDLLSIYKRYVFAKSKEKISWDPKNKPFIPLIAIDDDAGYVEIKHNFSPYNVLSFKETKIVRRGELVYTDLISRSEDTYMFYGYSQLFKNLSRSKWDKLTVKKRISRGKVHIDKVNGFWSYAKERLKKFHGLSPLTFPLYMKELELRYRYKDHKDDGIIFNILLDQLTDLPYFCT